MTQTDIAKYKTMQLHISFHTLPFIHQKKIRIEFYANYPLTACRIPQNTPSPLYSVYLLTVDEGENHLAKN